MSDFDTPADVLEMQTAAWRAMGPEGRVRLALEMSDEARDLTLAGIAGRHPEYSPEEARLALFRLLHGDELFQAVWHGQPLLDP